VWKVKARKLLSVFWSGDMDDAQFMCNDCGKGFAIDDKLGLLKPLCCSQCLLNALWCSGTQVLRGHPFLENSPARRASLRLHLWSSPQCHQRRRVWSVWIVVQGWPLIISAQTVKATGKISKVTRICIQHWTWTMKIGLTNSQMIFKDFMVNSFDNTVEMDMSAPQIFVNSLDLQSIMRIRVGRVSPCWGLFWRHRQLVCHGALNIVFPSKGRMTSPKLMNFWKSSKRPLTPPLIFGKSCCAFRDKIATKVRMFSMAGLLCIIWSYFPWDACSTTVQHGITIKLVENIP